MLKFNKEDIKPLDFIINECLKNGFSVDVSSLIKKGYIKLINEEGFGSLVSESNATQEFIRYLHILNEYGVCECNFKDDQEFASANSKTLYFQKEGGFDELYTKESVENKYQKSIRIKEDRIRSLTVDNLRLGNWDIRFRWYIAFVTFIIGFILKYFIDK